MLLEWMMMDGWSRLKTEEEEEEEDQTEMEDKEEGQAEPEKWPHWIFEPDQGKRT